MSKTAFDKIKAGALEALAFTRGEDNGCIVHLGDTPPRPEANNPLHKIKQGLPPSGKRGPLNFEDTGTKKPKPGERH